MHTSEDVQFIIHLGSNLNIWQDVSVTKIKVEQHKRTIVYRCHNYTENRYFVEFPTLNFYILNSQNRLYKPYVYVCTEDIHVPLIENISGGGYICFGQDAHIITKHIHEKQYIKVLNYFFTSVFSYSYFSQSDTEKFIENLKNGLIFETRCVFNKKITADNINITILD